MSTSSSIFSSSTSSSSSRHPTAPPTTALPLPHAPTTPRVARSATSATPSGAWAGLASVAGPSSSSSATKTLTLTTYISLLIGTAPYKVLDINPSNRTITLAQDEFVFRNNTCPLVPLNTTFNSTLFSFNNLGQNDVVNLTLLYQCPSAIPATSFKSKILANFTCNASVALAYYDDDARNSSYDLGCETRVEVPVFSEALKRLKSNETTLLDVLNEGFRVEYEMNVAACAACVDSGGACGSSAISPANFTCYCRHGASSSYPYQCPGKSKKTKIGTGVGVGILGSAVIIGALYFFYIRRYKKQLKLGSPTNTIQHSRIIPSSPYTLSNLKNGDNYFGVSLFSYHELEEATNHFNPSKELGDGGFGTVYHAKLGDGREVAIKRLYENNSKRVQQFMNEIEILARLRHKNLVSLYGYSSQQSRELLLVYEYVPNGTVADHLHGTKRSLTQTEYEVTTPLPWHTRLSIAIETASALVYLHASDIIHRDVKTNNILLDDNFSVKVADFGLSRLFPLDVTHVSTSPQGTPGYVDPEYHQCYHLTDKSDVYSFGVVLVELVSSKLAVDITRHRHEINLSNMAVHKIQNGLLHELVDLSLGFESDSKVKKEVNKVAELAFQCLQHDRAMRPTMEEVLETLTSIHLEIEIGRNGDVVDIPMDEAFRLNSDLSSTSSPEGRYRECKHTSQSSC